jgi:hypothetical protein
MRRPARFLAGRLPRTAGVACIRGSIRLDRDVSQEELDLIQIAAR